MVRFAARILYNNNDFLGEICAADYSSFFLAVNFTTVRMTR